MSVKYRIREFKNSRSDYNGYFYGQAVYNDVLDLDGIADLIERNCSMKKSDVKAVLTEMVEVFTDALQDSKVVKVDGLGRFKIGLRSHMTDTMDKFSASDIYGLKAVFQPEYTINKDGSRNTVLLEGATIEKQRQYVDGVDDKDLDAGEDNP